jgi:FecR protein
MRVRTGCCCAALAAALSGALALAVPGTAGAAVHPGSKSSPTTTTTTGQSKKSSAVAKLVIKPDSIGHVQVKPAGSTTLSPATDGESLHEGDTVQTDATGRAEIDYSSDAYTRLDVNTTFTIKKLTDNQGNRQVDGSLDSGRTWNRTAALTQSQSFQQDAGGSTAAVAGTAFVVDCTSAQSCTATTSNGSGAALFVSVIDNVILTGSNGQTRALGPLSQCTSTNGTLCGAVSRLTPDELGLIQWIQANVFLDFVERGLGNGIFQPFAVTSPASAAPAYPPSAPVIVVRPVGARSTRKLAFAGSSSSSSFPFAAAGVGLVLVGSVLTVAIRRRRSAHTLKV